MLLGVILLMVGLCILGGFIGVSASEKLSPRWLPVIVGVISGGLTATGIVFLLLSLWQ